MWPLKRSASAGAAVHSPLFESPSQPESDSRPLTSQCALSYLRSSNALYRRFDLHPVASLLLNERGSIVEANRQATSLLATNGSLPASQDFESLIAAEDLTSYRETCRALFETNCPQTAEARMNIEGKCLWAQLSMTLDRVDGSPFTQIAIVDLTPQKAAQRRLQEVVVEQQRVLLEKTVQFKELYHRVKNNLQVISSLLRMQAEMLQDQAAADVLQQSHLRILSMALIHECLYSEGKTHEMDFAVLANLLVGALFKSFGSPQRIKCVLNTASILLDADQAVPCGLIVNELVTNAFKYAYPNGASGNIRLQIRETRQRTIKFSVSDQGPGLPPGFDWKNSTSMGLTLVDLLAQQLGGTFTALSGPGGSFVVEFPRTKRTTMVE